MVSAAWAGPIDRWIGALDRILDGRSSRVPAILARLRELGIELTAADVAKRQVRFELA